MDIAFSPDRQQQFLYGPAGSNKKVQIRNREIREVLGFWGGDGGHGTGQFFPIYRIATDSKGNIYWGESFGKRVRKWTYKER